MSQLVITKQAANPLDAKALHELNPIKYLLIGN